MESQEKLRVLRDVFDIEWSEECDEDLVSLTRAVLTDEACEWYDDEAFIEMLLDELPDEHGVWEFIKLED